METNKQLSGHFNFIKTALTVGIVIVMNLFFNYSISFIYNEPDYTDFVKTSQVVEEIKDQESCLALGGQWNPNTVIEKNQNNVLEKISNGYCDVNYTNQKNYEGAIKLYERNVFITLVVLGVLSIVAGAFISVSVLPVAFSWGGVLSLVIASIRYWNSADKLIKVLILACALGALIWLAVKKFNQ
jgi:hypothetical protein